MYALLASTGVYSQNCNCYVAVDSTYQIVPMTLGTDVGTSPDYRCNDCSSQMINLPFNFCFYGKNYNSVYISNKGSISFVKPVYKFSNNGLPFQTDTMMLAAFWADIDDLQAPISFIYYKITATHMIVRWSYAGYNTPDDDNFDDFQITITNGSDSALPQGNNVSYCYLTMQWACANGNFGGTPATIGVTKGDSVHYAQFGAYCLPGKTFVGPFDTNSGLYWIEEKSFTFNTCVTGSIIPPVILRTDTCTTFDACVGDTLSFAASFLCSQKGQTATLTESSSGLSNITTNTSNAYSIYSLSNKVIASLSDSGIHTITVTATDNSSPPLTDSLKFIINVTKHCVDTTGINEITNNNNFTIYPNPSSGSFTIQTNNASIFQNSEIKVYDLPGRLIYSKKLNNNKTEIDLSNQSKGIYFVKLLNENILLGVNKVITQ